MNKTWWVKTEELDEDQKNVISLSVEGSYLVLGPPGSGKTNLLLLRAKHMALAGYPNLCILILTKTLREFLSSGAIEYNFDKNKIMTHMKFMKDLLREHLVQIELTNDFKKDRIELIKQIAKLVKERNLSNLYEVIFLDEAQDYFPEEILLFRKLCRRLFAVADPRQKIYEGKDPIETIKKIVDKTETLRYHYRNGLKICTLADEISKVMGKDGLLCGTSNYDEKANPSKVEITRCKDLDDQCEKILARLDTQFKAYPDEYIGIICFRRKELLHVRQFFLKSSFKKQINVENMNNKSITFRAGRNIVISTLHSAKGLEFRVLHIAGFEFIKKFSTQRNMSFTAVTRAKTILTVYHSDGLPPYFEQAYTNMNRPPDMPKLETLFPKEEN
ncbi:AAA family ATPase [bacterium]|nr:AAA family ATPase [bacterium]